MSGKLPLGEGEMARTACARGLLRAGVVEKMGETLSVAVLAQRVGWAADLVSGMAAELLAEHWNAADVGVLASGEDMGGQKLPSNAWMALRRLSWTAAPAGDMKVNDRIVRMAQEQAGRALRAANWRAELTAGALATWPADPGKRTAQEWDAVRGGDPWRLAPPVECDPFPHPADHRLHHEERPSAGRCLRAGGPAPGSADAAAVGV
ncbi:hypothetical protein [Streptomyces tailanensis]|uniref:hypothetical protein n=1 Tax=Streptomyces tailanensis TaxID=2569858 RepID=UPI001FEC7717|nr:hypothetical protein [Streptomyces tailanensis]